MYVLSYETKGIKFMTVGGEIDEALTSRLLNWPSIYGWQKNESQLPRDGSDDLGSRRACKWLCCLSLCHYTIMAPFWVPFFFVLCGFSLKNWRGPVRSTEKTTLGLSLQQLSKMCVSLILMRSCPNVSSHLCFFFACLEMLPPIRAKSQWLLFNQLDLIHLETKDER